MYKLIYFSASLSCDFPIWCFDQALYIDERDSPSCVILIQICGVPPGMDPNSIWEVQRFPRSLLRGHATAESEDPGHN
jgi:hypothetical protein